MNDIIPLLKRMSDGFFPILVMGLFMVVSMTLLSAATENLSRFGRMHLALVVVNLVGLVVLLGLIVVNVTRLVRQYRRKAIGSRLTTKLVVVFVVLSVAPVSVVFYFSMGFLKRGIDSWFDVRMEKAMEDALELSRMSLDLMMRELLRRTRGMSDALVGVSVSSAMLMLNDLRQANDATELSLLSNNGLVLATSNDDTLTINPQRPDDSILQEVRQNQSFTGLAPIKGLGLQVRVVVSVPSLEAGVAPHILYVLYPITDRISELAKSVESAYGQYKQITYLREPLKYSFRLTLSLVLLLSILTAIWAAFFSAQRLVSPIRILAIGTRAVAAGNYDKRLPDVSNDELGELVKSFSDMTEKLALTRDQAKLSQDAVEQEKAYLGAVLGRLSSGVITLDERMNLRVANASASQILEVDLSEILGKPLGNMLLQSEHLQGFVQQVTRHLQTDLKDWREEIQLKQKTGTKLLICQGVRLKAEHMEHSGVVIVFDDVTTFMQAQREAAWGDVARRLAHEIKNPLTPIQLSAERLKRKLLHKVNTEDAVILERATHTIVQQVQTMKELVQAFSEYARAPQIALRPLYIDQIVKEVLDLYEEEDFGVKFQAEFSADHPEVAADPGRIRQLLHNLIKNAMESTKGVLHPTIHISVCRVPFKEGTAAQLRVSDNGHGVPEQLLKHLFEPLTSTQSKGGGLGLTVVQRIVEEHSGKLYAENNPLTGASFVVQIPAIDNPKAERKDLLMQAT